LICNSWIHNKCSQKHNCAALALEKIERLNKSKLHYKDLPDLPTLNYSMERDFDSTIEEDKTEYDFNYNKLDYTMVCNDLSFYHDIIENKFVTWRHLDFLKSARRSSRAAKQIRDELYQNCLLTKQGKLELFIVNDLEKKLKSSIEKIVDNSEISLYIQLVLLPSTIIKIFITKNLEINDNLEAFKLAEEILMHR
jgi:hypothetical protein